VTTSITVRVVHGTLPAFDGPTIGDRSLVPTFERVRTVSGNDLRPSAMAGTGTNGRGVPLLASDDEEHVLPQRPKRTPEARR
jgi:hypothetical protein